VWVGGQGAARQDACLCSNWPPNPGKVSTFHYLLFHLLAPLFHYPATRPAPILLTLPPCLQQEYAKVCRDIAGARVVAGALLQGGDGISGHAGNGTANGNGDASHWINTGAACLPACCMGRHAGVVK